MPNKRSRSISPARTTDNVWASEGGEWGCSGGWGSVDDISAVPALKKIRSDFNDAGLTAQGAPDRVTSLDGLDDKEWARAQCMYSLLDIIFPCLRPCNTGYRASKRGQREFMPFPTFTRDETKLRLARVEGQIAQKDAERREKVNSIAKFTSQLRSAKDKANSLHSELLDLAQTKKELGELADIAAARLN